MPSIVIVGRPNVGKSTLFNRLTGTRRSIVTNEPGITRDRIYGKAEWEGRAFEVVDTGGIVPEDKAGIPGEILRQARVAIENATRVVQVVDGRDGPVPLDQELAQLLRRAGKPPVIAVNKVDSPKQAELAAQFYELGDEIFPISAEHGFGIDTLLDALTQDFPEGRSAASRSRTSTSRSSGGRTWANRRCSISSWARSAPSFRPSPAPRAMPSIRWSSTTARHTGSSIPRESAARARRS